MMAWRHMIKLIVAGWVAGSQSKPIQMSKDLIKHHINKVKLESIWKEPPMPRFLCMKYSTSSGF